MLLIGIADMKKYTVVYTDGQMYGSHYAATTRYKRIETDDISKVWNDSDGAIWFIFEGHPKLEGEEATDRGTI